MDAFCDLALCLGKRLDQLTPDDVASHPRCAAALASGGGGGGGGGGDGDGGGGGGSNGGGGRGRGITAVEREAVAAAAAAAVKQALQSRLATGASDVPGRVIRPYGPAP